MDNSIKFIYTSQDFDVAILIFQRVISSIIRELELQAIAFFGNLMIMKGFKVIGWKVGYRNEACIGQYNIHHLCFTRQKYHDHDFKKIVESCLNHPEKEGNIVIFKMLMMINSIFHHK